MSPNKPASSSPVIILDHSATSSPHLRSPQLPYRNITESPNVRRYGQTNHQVRLSSPIAPSERLNAALLAACIEAEAEDFEGEVEDLGKDVVDQVDETATHKAFLEEELDSDLDDSISDESSNYGFEDFEDSESYEKDSNNEREQSNQSTSNLSQHYPQLSGTRSARSQSVWIDSCKTTHAKEKLVRILSGEAKVPKQWWGIERILATLTYHREDKRLRSAYRQFKRFAYKTMLEESDKSEGRWPTLLTRKD